MSPKGTGTPAHIRALDKTPIGEGCWEYGGKIGVHPQVRAAYVPRL